jgi:hypothetical protein
MGLLFIVKPTIVLVVNIFGWVWRREGRRRMGLAHVVLLLVLMVVNHWIVMGYVVGR